MSYAAPPRIEYNLLLGKALPSGVLAPRANTNEYGGALSSAQLEAVTYACQRFSKKLPNGRRCGFFLGDGVGLGKGRTLAGMVGEAWAAGHNRHLWVSVSADLCVDSLRDLKDVGLADKVPIVNITKLPHGPIATSKSAIAPNGFKKGVLFSTYSALLSTGSLGQVGSKRRVRRLDQIIEWLGGDKAEGCVLFDESHKAKHLSADDTQDKDGGGGDGGRQPAHDNDDAASIVAGRAQPAAKKGKSKNKSTKMAMAVQELQSRCPNGRVVYCSATGASSLANMAYMDRLGLWGAGTAFADFATFEKAISDGGTGAMELVALDMKRRGMYISRQLSFKSASYATKIIDLSPRQTDVYDAAANFWLELHAGFVTALEVLDVRNTKGHPAGRVMTHYWSCHQRFFRQLCMAMKVPDVVSQVKAALADNKCVVIGLQTTGESRLVDAVRAGDDLDEFAGMKEVVRFLLEKFPTGDYLKKYPDVEASDDDEEDELVNRATARSKARDRNARGWKSRRMGGGGGGSASEEDEDDDLDGFIVDDDYEEEEEGSENWSDLDERDEEEESEEGEESEEEEDGERRVPLPQAVKKLSMGQLRELLRLAKFGTAQNAVSRGQLIAMLRQVEGMHRNGEGPSVSSLLATARGAPPSGERAARRRAPSAASSSSASTSTATFSREDVTTLSIAELKQLISTAGMDLPRPPIEKAVLISTARVAQKALETRAARPSRGERARPRTSYIEISDDDDELDAGGGRARPAEEQGEDGPEAMDVDDGAPAAGGDGPHALLDKMIRLKRPAGGWRVGQVIAHNAESNKVHLRYSADDHEWVRLRDVRWEIHSSRAAPGAAGASRRAKKGADDDENVGPQGRPSSSGSRRPRAHSLVSDDDDELGGSDSGGSGAKRKAGGGGRGGGKRQCAADDDDDDAYDEDDDAGAADEVDDNLVCFQHRSRVEIQMLQKLKAGLLKRLNRLKMPDNPLDSLINLMGGPEQVAEMTGRKGRLVRDASGKTVYAKRNEGEVDEQQKKVAMERINLAERKNFMEGRKLVAIISEAASSGISLQADRRVANRRRRVHMTLELPWSADQCIQQCGRTHRSNQVHGPEYVLMMTACGGERRFASTVAKRLQQLGALTKGDRRAADASELSAFDVDTKYGKKAMEAVLDMLTSAAVSAQTPPPRHVREALGIKAADANSLHSEWSSYLSDAEEAIAGSGIDSEHAASRLSTKKFLNRLLGLPLQMQNRIFSHFSAELDEQVHIAKRAGAYDEGVVDIRGESIRVERISDLALDATSAVPLQHYKLAVDRGVSLDKAKTILAEKAASNESKELLRSEGFYRSRRPMIGREKEGVHAIAILVQKPKPAFALNWINHYKQYRPNTGLSNDVVLSQFPYDKVEPEVAAKAWVKNYSDALTTCAHGPNCKNRPHCRHGMRNQPKHVLTGAVLPYWAHIQGAVGWEHRMANRRDGTWTKKSRMRIVRVATTDANGNECRIVGIEVNDESALKRVADNVSASAGADRKPNAKPDAKPNAKPEAKPNFFSSAYKSVSQLLGRGTSSHASSSNVSSSHASSSNASSSHASSSNASSSHAPSSLHSHGFRPVSSAAPASRPRLTPAHPFYAKQRVRVTGLQAAAHYNEAKATVLRYDAKEMRYEVSLDESGPRGQWKAGQKLMVRPQCIKARKSKP